MAIEKRIVVTCPCCGERLLVTEVTPDSATSSGYTTVIKVQHT